MGLARDYRYDRDTNTMRHAFDRIDEARMSPTDGSLVVLKIMKWKEYEMAFAILINTILYLMKNF